MYKPYILIITIAYIIKVIPKWIQWGYNGVYIISNGMWEETMWNLALPRNAGYTGPKGKMVINQWAEWDTRVPHDPMFNKHPGGFRLRESLLKQLKLGLHNPELGFKMILDVKHRDLMIKRWVYHKGQGWKIMLPPSKRELS